MKKSKLIKTILFSFIYGINLFFALSLWLCGRSGKYFIRNNIYYTLSIKPMAFAACGNNCLLATAKA